MQDSPFQTIAHAAGIATTGDTVFVLAGVYNEENIEIKNSGTAQNPLIFQEENNDVIVQGTFHLLGTVDISQFLPKILSFGCKIFSSSQKYSSISSSKRKFFAQNSRFFIKKHLCQQHLEKSHIHIEGFTIENPPENPGIGIYIEGEGKDIEIKNNTIRNTHSSAIAAWGVPWKENPSPWNLLQDIRIIDNTIENCVDGGWNECITFANGVSDFEISGNSISWQVDTTSGGEGIDIKEGSHNGKIINNRVVDIGRLGIYIDGGRLPEQYASDVYDILIADNFVSQVKGEGITLVSEGLASVKNITIKNNIVEASDRNGILIYDHSAVSSEENSIENISILHNTLVYNGTEEGHGAYGIRIDYPKTSDIILRDNLLWNNENPIGIDTNTPVENENNLFGRDPLFTNPAAGDYSLQDNSPAKGKATDTFDIGVIFEEDDDEIVDDIIPYLCHLFSADSSDFPADFAAPWNLFSQAKELLIQGLCTEDGLEVTLGSGNNNQYIWHEIYYTQNGKEWEDSVLLTEEKWIPASAEVLLPKILISDTTPNYIAAYICTYVEKEWKCGCKDAETCTANGEWMVQKIQGK